MVLTKTPICDFGKKADYFELKSIDNKIISIKGSIPGKKNTVVLIKDAIKIKKLLFDLFVSSKKLFDDVENIKTGI